MTASIPTPHSFEDHRIDNLYDCEGRPSADALFAAYSIIMETLPALVEADGALARLDTKILALASETLHRLFLWTLYAKQHPEAYELGVLCERCLEIGRDDTNYRAPAAGCCEECTEEAAEGVAEGEEENNPTVDAWNDAMEAQ